MDDTGCVRGGQGIGDLDGILQSVVQPNSLVWDRLVERFAAYRVMAWPGMVMLFPGSA